MASSFDPVATSLTGLMVARIRASISGVNAAPNSLFRREISAVTFSVWVAYFAISPVSFAAVSASALPCTRINAVSPLPTEPVPPLALSAAASSFSISLRKPSICFRRASMCCIAAAVGGP